MAITSNSVIHIRRSYQNTAPTTLEDAELGYSFVSNTLFIGTEDSSSYLEIGSWSNLANLHAGTYGSATSIPVVTVDQFGRVQQAGALDQVRFSSMLTHATAGQTVFSFSNSQPDQILVFRNGNRAISLNNFLHCTTNNFYTKRQWYNI